ncbi:hypothetical protein BC936DRAFT_138848 [Jimgerdemannia flammicorona]|uniref:Uncharacterized protein n=1 Tax=Jimgerdemannia flammicorona TaxID=994334 RepID=A0A433BGD8_9FUNG|nr:hypothetical protein BC936DRAFT_138848 [Jimgerdemannia flammicorona]
MLGKGPEGKYICCCRVMKAASIPLAGLTAWRYGLPHHRRFDVLHLLNQSATPMLIILDIPFTMANVQSVDLRPHHWHCTELIRLPPGGDVVLAALQYAVAVGANVYITSSDDSKIKRAVEPGAASIIKTVRSMLSVAFVSSILRVDHDWLIHSPNPYSL